MIKLQFETIKWNEKRGGFGISNTKQMGEGNGIQLQL